MIQERKKNTGRYSAPKGVTIPYMTTFHIVIQRIKRTNYKIRNQESLHMWSR